LETLCRLLALAALSVSETKVLILGRADVSGSVIVEELADDGKDEEIMTDMAVQRRAMDRMDVRVTQETTDSSVVRVPKLTSVDEEKRGLLVKGSCRAWNRAAREQGKAAVEGWNVAQRLGQVSENNRVKDGG
jgi:hypothetical protein